MLGVAWPPRGLGQQRRTSGSLQLDASLPSALTRPRMGDQCDPGGNGGGRMGGPCPMALPASRCRSGCGWHGPGRRAAGTPRRWSRCSRRSRCRRPCCGQRGDPRLEGREMLTLTWVPCLGVTPVGQGMLPGASWFGGTSIRGKVRPKQMGQGQHRDGDVLPMGCGDTRARSCSTGRTQRV